MSDHRAIRDAKRRLKLASTILVGFERLDRQDYQERDLRDALDEACEAVRIIETALATISHQTSPIEERRPS